jgi:hypothetical protein
LSGTFRPNADEFYEDDDEDEYVRSPSNRQSLTSFDPPPEPEIRMLLPDEKIDFGPIKQNYDYLQDQVTRLLNTLDGSRREVAELKKQRDELLEFKNYTVSFYSMMQRGMGTQQPDHSITSSLPVNPSSPAAAVIHYQSLPSNQVVQADFKSSQPVVSTTTAPVISSVVLDTTGAAAVTTPATETSTGKPPATTPFAPSESIPPPAQPSVQSVDATKPLNEQTVLDNLAGDHLGIGTGLPFPE